MASSTGPNSTERNTKNTAMIPSARPKSPTRLVTKALIDASFGAFLVYQNPISRYEASPTPSQPKKSWMKLSATTSISIMNVNRDR